MSPSKEKMHDAIKVVAIVIIGLLLIFIVGKIWYLQNVQSMIIYSTPGMPYAESESVLGEPEYEYSLEKWTEKHPDFAEQLPKGIMRIVQYRVLSTYCYIYVGDSGFVLGSYWFLT